MALIREVKPLGAVAIPNSSTKMNIMLSNSDMQMFPYLSDSWHLKSKNVGIAIESLKIEYGS